MDLLALLNWKAHPDRVLDILGRLRQISGEEIVKVTVIALFIFFLFILYYSLNKRHFQFSMTIISELKTGFIAMFLDEGATLCFYFS